MRCILATLLVLCSAAPAAAGYFCPIGERVVVTSWMVQHPAGADYWPKDRKTHTKGLAATAKPA